MMNYTYAKSLFADGQVNATVLRRAIEKFTPIQTIDASVDPVVLTFVAALEPEIKYELDTFIVPEHRGGDPTPYPFQISDFDTRQIQNLVEGVAGYSHVTTEGNTVTVWFSSELSAADLTTLQGIATDTLPIYKKRKKDAIDARTTALIMGGFEYPAASGNVHSLSVQAQINISNVPSIADDPGTAYPVKASTQNNGAVIKLNNPAELRAYYAAALAHKAGNIASGNDLKEQVIAATDQTAVDAVVDNR